MQILRVLGASDDGRQLLCGIDGEADGPDRQVFALPLDARLHTALGTARGGTEQLEIEMEPQLRPREIQDRIRAGATAEQVAAAAGCPVARVEPFAYPVLMERAAVAERAGRVRPFAAAALGSEDADRAEATLTEIVAETLAERGQGEGLAWDAYRDERGWTVTASWRAGRSENRAEWSFRPRADGGTVTARNEAAADLVDPGPRALRTVEGAPAAGSTGAADSGAGGGTDRASDPTPLPIPSVDTGTDGPAPRAKPRRGHRPAMPSWEEVLMSTRTAQK